MPRPARYSGCVATVGRDSTCSTWSGTSSSRTRSLPSIRRWVNRPASSTLRSRCCSGRATCRAPRTWARSASPTSYRPSGRGRSTTPREPSMSTERGSTRARRSWSTRSATSTGRWGTGASPRDCGSRKGSPATTSSSRVPQRVSTAANSSSATSSDTPSTSASCRPQDGSVQRIRAGRRPAR